MNTLAASHISHVLLDATQREVSVFRSASIIMAPIDLMNGVRGNVWCDPVSFALKRAVPFSRQVRVSLVDIAFTVGHPRNGTVEHERYCAETPAHVATWLKMWDAGKPVLHLAPFVLTWNESD